LLLPKLYTASDSIFGYNGIASEITSKRKTITYQLSPTFTRLNKVGFILTARLYTATMAIIPLCLPLYGLTHFITFVGREATAIISQVLNIGLTYILHQVVKFTRTIAEESGTRGAKYNVTNYAPWSVGPIFFLTFAFPLSLSLFYPASLIAAPSRGK
jgi:hypothetical protein